MTVPAPASELDTTTVVVRPATLTDVDALIELRSVMFDTTDRDPGPEEDTWQRACRQILLDGLTAGDLLGAVAETDDGTVVASGIATLRRWLPSPTNPSGLTGYIGSMATVDEWRRQGIGRRITETLIAMLTERGAADIDVHPTEVGEGVYRSLGFTEPSTGTGLTLHTNAD